MIYSDAVVDVQFTVGKTVFMATNILMRDPLSSTTNHSNSPPPSPPTLLGKEGKAPPVEEVPVGTHRTSPTLRRRDTVKCLINLDSSESYPSLHSSLYDASIDPDSAVSGTHSEDAWIYTTGYNEPPPAWANTVCSTSGDIVPASFLEPILSQKLHSPHKLYPIIERRSFTTLQVSSRAGSLNNRPSTLTLLSGRSRSPGLNGERQKSFSLSDLPEQAITESLPTHEASPPASVHLVPQPNEPLHPPPIRSSTPPNLPRFGTLEACTYRLPRPCHKSKTDNGKDSQSNKRKKKRKNTKTRLWSSTAEVREWRRQTVSLPKNVIMRGDDGTLVKGKFMPTNSGHNGTVTKAGPRGGLGDGQGNMGRSPHIAPNVRAAPHHSERGTRAIWTDAVMTGGIGAGPGMDPRYTTSALRTQRDQLDRETRRKMKIKRKEGLKAWKAFLGLSVDEDEIGNGRCCVCSKRMWWFCPLAAMNAPSSEADMAARPVLLQNGVR